MTLPYKNIDYQREIKELQLLLEKYHTIDEILKDLQLIVKEKNIDLHIVHKSYSSYQLEEMNLSKVDNEK